jgi:hypothetical protein
LVEGGGQTGHPVLKLPPEFLPSAYGPLPSNPMPDADVESDPIFPLLTDALRAGPGSPQWHQAVAKLRAEGLAGGDEYRLLVSVREHLASGRDYRSIRAGPGFTRKVMAAVEQERQQPAGRRPGGPSLVSVIAALSVVVVVGVLAVLAYQFVFKGPATQASADDLAEVYFPRADVSATFDGGTLPKDWRVVGALALDAGKGGLRPAARSGDGASRPSGAPPLTLPATPGTAAAAAETVGGAVVAPVTIHPDEPFAVEVKLKLGRPADDLIVQVFVSSEGDFSPDKSTSSKEVAWLIQGGRQKVVLGGEADSRVLFDGQRPDGGGPAAGGPKAEPVTVRVNVNREFAVAFAGGQRVWAGPNGLSAKPRYVGVRFLRVDPTKPLTDPPVVQSIRLLRK